jgi:TRAP-type C4-dicarboxylate transport system permease small subunit
MGPPPDAAATHRGAERWLRAVASALAAVGALALACMFLLVLAAVVMRYLWGRPFAFTEELSGLFMTVAVFTLLPATVLKEVHIRVTVVSGITRGPLHRILFLVGQLILLAFCVVFVREAWGIAEFTYNLNLKSEHSRLPLAPFLILATVSMGLAGVAGLWRTLRPMQPEPEEVVHP